MAGKSKSNQQGSHVLLDCGLLLLVAAALAGLSFWLNPKTPTWEAIESTKARQVELSEIENWKEQVLWVDARAEESYRQQHIPDATPLNDTSWEKLVPAFLEKWKPDVRVVVYCDSQKCDASTEVAARLIRDLNLPNVYVLKGGWQSWLKNQH